MPPVFNDSDAVSVLKSLAVITAGACGSEFLSRLTCHLLEQLEATAVLVAEVTDADADLPQARSIALAHGGTINHPLEFTLVGDLAGAAISAGKTLLKTADELRESFPSERLADIFQFDTCITSPIFLSDGEPAGFISLLLKRHPDACGSIVSVAEITAERIGAELQRVGYQAAASVSERRFRDFAETASDWFWEMDEHLRFSYFSERFTEITGVPKQALLGKTRQETGIPNVDEQAWQDHLVALASHQPFKNFVHPRTMQDGAVVWLSISGRPVIDEDGTFIGYRGIGPPRMSIC